jgi:hypothetical protein
MIIQDNCKIITSLSKLFSKKKIKLNWTLAKKG